MFRHIANFIGTAVDVVAGHPTRAVSRREGGRDPWPWPGADDDYHATYKARRDAYLRERDR